MRGPRRVCILEAYSTPFLTALSSRMAPTWWVAAGLGPPGASRRRAIFKPLADPPRLPACWLRGEAESSSRVGGVRHAEGGARVVVGGRADSPAAQGPLRKRGLSETPGGQTHYQPDGVDAMVMRLTLSAKEGRAMNRDAPLVLCMKLAAMKPRWELSGATRY